VKTISIYGDSLSNGNNTPGGVLANELRNAGYDVIVNAKDGRSTKAGLPGEAVPVNGLVLLFLGSNDIGSTPSVHAKRLREIRDTARGGNASIIGIGPPSFPKGTKVAGIDANAGAAQVYATMRHELGRVVDSRPLTLDLDAGRTSDGVHFQRGKGSAAESYGKRLASHLLGNGKAPAPSQGEGAGLIVMVSIVALGLFLALK
jgi:hypothetical protein